ncbi:hypothetical protein [Microbacterium sp. SORGH_AS_0862]|uniref:hypothetical protein n=1 Tax=Microbacterium sp. SORGH_AS_0862 TaxID=3041789 RepID=UPI002794FC3B|nr:hypothetical protein [Microbacterium sp. SORGH_AS_0862]MDQ1205076.1 hypothetical protein [Microbacterium sp. SORGH_AS_0862]
MNPVERFRRRMSDDYAELSKLTVEEHAKRAHRVGGPSLEALEARIRELRAMPLPVAA